MKKVLFGTGILALAALAVAFAKPLTSTENVPAPAAIQWMTWEQAQEAMKDNPKKMFIDVYTDWCGWCKRMDADTFTDEAVIAYMNEHYYAVKFNAEGRENHQYKGKTLGYLENASRRGGVNQLAIVLLNGRLGYPSFVYLDENQDPLKISPGYKTADVMLSELKSIAQPQ